MQYRSVAWVWSSGDGLRFVYSNSDIKSDITEFDGIGIKPDIEVYPIIKGVQQDRDEVLERAVELSKDSFYKKY